MVEPLKVEMEEQEPTKNKYKFKGGPLGVDVNIYIDKKGDVPETMLIALPRRNA